jgi:hypothetical protein
MNIGCKDTYFFLNILRFRGIFVLNNKKAAYTITYVWRLFVYMRELMIHFI